MLILKSFFRKKNTKKYILLFSFLFIAIFGLFFVKKYYTLKMQENYQDAFIEFVAPYQELKNIQKMSFFQRVDYGLDIEYQNETFTLLHSMLYPVSKDNTFISLKYQDVLKIDDSLSFEVLGNFTNLKINGYYDQAYSDVFFVNDSVINDLISQNKMILYRVTLKNWMDREEVISKIKKNVNFEEKYGIVQYLYKKNDINLEGTIGILQILLSFLLLLFALVFFLTIYNVFCDEQILDRMYFYLGFSKNSRKIFFFSKILFLFLVSFCFAVVITFLLLFLYLK